MEPSIPGVNEPSTATPQEIQKSHGSVQQNDFTCRVQYNLFGNSENPLMQWHSVFNRTTDLDPIMGSFQHNQMLPFLQSLQPTIASFDPTIMPDVYPMTYPFYSNKPPSPSYEQFVNPIIGAERVMMASWPNLLPSLVNQYQNTLQPTGEECGSNSQTLSSNGFNNNDLTTYFEPYTLSKSPAETHSPTTTTSIPHSSKSRRRHSQGYRKAQRPSTTARVSMPVPCMACKAARIRVCSLSSFEAVHTSKLIGSKCVGLPDCKWCQSKCIPGQIYITVDLSQVLNFDKCSYTSVSICFTSNDRIGLAKEYERKRVYPPTHYLCEVKVACLQHHVNGPELVVKCYYFEPDLTEPSQTTIYWKEESWKEAKTTAVSLTSLNYDLEPYIEQMVDIVLNEACNGPHYIAKFFQEIRKFRKVSNPSYRFVA